MNQFKLEMDRGVFLLRSDVSVQATDMHLNSDVH
jgi:hypothetical protein